jgi:hypothetical protein
MIAINLKEKGDFPTFSQNKCPWNAKGLTVITCFICTNVYFHIGISHSELTGKLSRCFLHTGSVTFPIITIPLLFPPCLHNIGYLMPNTHYRKNITIKYRLKGAAIDQYLAGCRFFYVVNSTKELPLVHIGDRQGHSAIITCVVMVCNGYVKSIVFVPRNNDVCW